MTPACCAGAVSGSAALMTSRMLVGVAEPGFDRNARQHAPVGADDDDVPAGGGAPGRNEAGQQKLQAIECRAAILPD